MDKQRRSDVPWRRLASWAAIILASGAVLVVVFGCSRLVAKPAGRQARIVAEVRGVIVMTEAWPGATQITTVGPDGLVEHLTLEATAPAELGEVDAAEARRLVGIAIRDGFFTWRSRYAYDTSAPSTPGAELVRPLTVLAISTEDGRRHSVRFARNAVGLPDLLPELVGQVRSLRTEALARPFPPQAARAIVAAKRLFAAKSPTLEETSLAKGPCLSEEVVSGWCVDIAHDPRRSVDEERANQCRRYLDGDVDHLVELAPNGDFIRAE